MTQPEHISDEQLNAFLDNELDDNERARVLDAIKQNKSVADRLNELHRLKDMMLIAYNAPPQPRKTGATAQLSNNRLLYACAAFALLMVGGIAGWFLNEGSNASRVNIEFSSVQHLNPQSKHADKVLLHISTMDKSRVSATLDAVESLADNARTRAKPLELEVVANAEGLQILREGSPYAQRIKNITLRHKNVSFLACGIAKETAKLREGREIALVPEAREIPAALEEILSRIKGGWLYVRG